MKYTFVLLILSVTLNCYGQTAKPELITSSGDNFTSTSQQISWSLGEVVVETFTNGNSMITQGFQQSSYLVTAIYETEIADMKIVAFPNPATDFVSIQITETNLQTDKYVITLTDIQGKKLLIFNSTTNNPKISLSNYGAGTYFLTVSKIDKILKTFKIIK